MKSTRSLIGILILGLVASLPATAAARDHGPRDGHGGPMMHALEQLDLEPAQREAIQARMEQLRVDSKPLRDASRVLREEMHALVTAERWDAAAAAVLADRHAALAADRALLHAEAMHEVYALLDHAQRAELESLRDERHQRRERRGDTRPHRSEG